MSLRNAYEPVDTEGLKELLAETHTERRRKVIATILAERGHPQLEWTSTRAGWQWNTDGWEISRHMVTHDHSDQTMAVYRVWRSRGAGHIAEFMEECPDLPAAMDFVQRFEDNRKPKTDYESQETDEQYWDRVGHKTSCPTWGDENETEFCTCGKVNP